MSYALEAAITRLTERVTPYITGELKAPDWNKPFRITPLRRPWNTDSKKSYRGNNVGLLAATRFVMGYATNEWGTYRQWKEQGAQVQKGQKSTLILYYQQIVKEENGEKSAYNLCKTYPVFNRDQTDHPAIVKDQNDNYTSQLVGDIQRIYHWLGVKHRIDPCQFPCYYPSRDEISMPPVEHFIDTPEHSHTALHELGHWTGHKERLNRNLSAGTIDKNAYAQEELVAETFAGVMGQSMGYDIGINMIAYLVNWSTKLPEGQRLDRFHAAITDMLEAVYWCNKQIEIIEDLENQELEEKYQQAKGEAA